MRSIIGFCVWLLISPHTLAAFDHSYANWNKALNEVVVSSGAASKVRYKTLSKNAMSLNTYIKEMQRLTAKEFEAFTVDQKKAFWINAYNAYTIKLVADHYPIKSIKDIGSLLQNTWKIKFIILFGKTINLDHIEHEILRKEFPDARIHFALNCASIGCPKLRSEAYVAEKLNDQLNEQARIFLQDTTRNRIDIEKKVIYLSKIFSWFKEDFTRDQKTVVQFVAPWITEDIKLREELVTLNFSIDYLDYDWALNDEK